MKKPSPEIVALVDRLAAELRKLFPKRRKRPPPPPAPEGK